MIDKTGYEKIKIPGELEMVVQEAIVEGLSERRKGNWYSRIKGVVPAVLLLCIVSALNLSPTFAATACELPVVGNLCRVFLFQEYHSEDVFKYVEAKIPQIENTGKTESCIRRKD